MTEGSTALAGCPKCDGSVRSEARFCHRCGTELWPLRRCGHCGEQTPADGRFCDRCGGEQAGGTADVGAPSAAAARKADAAPAGVQPASRSEKRVVTVMFADVSGFTRMSETMEPEDVTEVMNLLFDRLTEIVVEEGGTVDKYIGDCVMAVFGAPRSYGDDAERAARAGLRMQHAVDELGASLLEKTGTPLRLRIGLNTGFVMAGWVGGAGHRGYTVMGDTVNLASRMESACEPGRVLISANTQRFVADRFVVTDAGTLQVKGKADAVQAFHVERERQAGLGDRQFSFEGVPIPFVGRQREMELLTRVWREVGEAGGARVAAIEAPSGSGKSRLLTELCRRVHADDPAVDIVYGRATGQTGEVLMRPLHMGLSGLLTRRHGSASAGVRALLGEVKDESNEALAAARTVLTDWFAGAELFSSGSEGRTVRQTLFWAIARLLGRLTDERPMVLLISDAHLADEALCELVAYLAGDAAPKLDAAILWEFQTGAEETSAQVLDVSGERIDRIDLSALSTSEVSDLVRAILEPAGHVPEWVTSSVVSQCEGNPLYAIEHLRSLRALGYIEIDAETGAWSIKDSPPTDTALPATIHASLQASLDALPDVDRAVLRTAAVVGRVFWDGVVSDLLESEAPPEAVERSLQALRVQGILRQRASTAFAGLVEYRFQSDLFQRVCRDAIPHKERRQQHRAVAACLEELGAEVNHPLRLVRHYEAGGLPERALPVLLDLADRSLASYSLGEAREAVRRAESLLAGSDGAEGKRLAGVASRVRLAYAAGQLAWFDGELDGALEVVRDAEKLLALPERRVETEDRHEGFHRARLADLRGRVLKHRDDLAGAAQAFREAVQRARDESLDEAMVVGFEADLAWSLAKQGDEKAAESLLRAVFERHPAREVTTPALANAVARHHDTWGEILRGRGELEEAAAHCRTARTLREIDGNVGLLAHSDGNLGVTRAMAGDVEGAAQVFGRVLGLWSALGDRRLICISRLNLAKSLIHLGRRAEAAENLDAAEAIAARLGADQLLEVATALRGELAAGEAAAG